MKNIIIIFSLLVGGIWSNIHNVSAQTEENSNLTTKFFLGGSLALNNTASEGVTSSTIFIPVTNFNFNIITEASPLNNFSFGASPYFGIRLSPKKSIGVLTNFQYTRNKFLTSEDEILFSTNVRYGFGLFFRNDFRINDKLIFFFQPTISYDREEARNSLDGIDNFDNERRSFSAFAYIGARYAFNERWSLITNISTGGYQFQVVDELFFNRRTNIHTVSANLSLERISFGLERFF